MSKPNYIFEADLRAQKYSVVNGNGVEISVRDEETGKVIDCIDGMTGAAVGALGWKDPDIPGFFAEGLRQTNYSFTAVLGNDHAQALSKFIIENSPQNAFAASLFVTSGSEANDNAMKIMRQYFVEKGKPRKTKFVSRENAYLGFSIGSMSLSRGMRSDLFKEIILPRSQCPTIDACYPYREQGALTTEEYVEKLLKQAENVILDEDPETIAGISLETLPGATLGTVPLPEGYLNGIRDLCDKYDILLHLDEVICGMSRCNPNGRLHCWENYLQPGKGPDIETIGKTLGSGYVTIAGVLISPKVKNGFLLGSGKVIGGQLYNCHSLNCYVALKIQEKIKQQNLSQNIFAMGNLLGKLLQDQLSECPIVGDVRGLGGFWSIEIVKDRATKESFPLSLDMCGQAAEFALQNGVTTLNIQGCNGGVEGDLILFGPAYVITEEVVRDLVKRVVRSFVQLVQKLKCEGTIH